MFHFDMKHIKPPPEVNFESQQQSNLSYSGTTCYYIKYDDLSDRTQFSANFPSVTRETDANPEADPHDAYAPSGLRGSTRV